MSPLMNDCHDSNKSISDHNGLYGGQAVDQCASYTIQPSYREALYCVTDPRFTDEDRETYRAFKRDDALEAIQKFCSSGLVADPNAENVRALVASPKTPSRRVLLKGEAAGFLSMSSSGIGKSVLTTHRRMKG